MIIRPAGMCARLTLLVCGLAALTLTMGPSAAKTPGSTYCFLSTCHRVLTLAETAEAVAKPRQMHASFYDDPSRDRFNPSLMTSSGELFRPDAPNNAASPIYPDGTLVAVFAPSTRRGAIVRINNAGPYYGNRLIDLSRGLAEKLGVAKSGVASVTVEVLAAPRPEEARYRRGRQYPPVAGYIGTVGGIGEVRLNWQLRESTRTLVALAGGTALPAALRPPVKVVHGPATALSFVATRPWHPHPIASTGAITPVAVSLQSPIRWPTLARAQTLFR